MDKISTNRLLLRALEKEDAQALFDYAKLDNVGPSAGWQPHKSIEESQKIIEYMIKSNEVWAITLKDSKTMIGSIGLHKKEHQNNELEVGYVLNPTYWHQGYMIEAVRALIQYAFSHLGIKKLHCAHFKENINSKKVIDKAGFKPVKEKKMKIHLYGFEIEKDSIEYELTKADFERMYDNDYNTRNKI